MASDRSGGNKGQDGTSAFLDLESKHSDKKPATQAGDKTSSSAGPSSGFVPSRFAGERQVLALGDSLSPSSWQVSWENVFFRRLGLEPGKFPSAPANDNKPLEEELRHLKSRVEQLEKLVHSLISKSKGIEPPPASSTNAHSRWIEEHLDLIRRHPDCFVAIDPSRGDKGLVVSETDEAAFQRQLFDLYKADPSARERLLLTHTSIY